MQFARLIRSALVLAAAAAVTIAYTAPSVAAETPTKGGILKYVVPAEPPSFDGHRETTFALIHPIAPFYSLLVRVDPTVPYNGKFACDLCTELPEATDGGKTYTFHIRKGVKFSDGSDLTAKDVVATFNKIIFPPKGVASARKAFFVMVDSVSAPDDNTVRVQAQVSVRRLHAVGREPVQLHLFQGDPRQGHALV